MRRLIDSAALGRAVDRCFDAVVDPVLWPVVLDAISDAAGCTGAVMFAFGRRDRGSFVCSPRCAEPMDRYLASDWCANNPRLQHPPGNRITSDADFMADERQARNSHAFREEFMRRNDMGWFAGMSLFRDRDRNILISVERAYRHGGFESDELQILDVAFQRMRRAVALVPILEARLRTAMLDGFQSRGQAVAVLGRHGALLHMNVAAEAILPSVLHVRHGLLHAADALVGPVWERFVARLVASMNDLALAPAPVVLTVAQVPSVQVRGCPLPSNADLLSPGAGALLFLHALRLDRVEADVFRSVHGLSAAEARLASALSGGNDLKGACREIGIGWETARTHLKAIYAKIGAHSRSGLADEFARLR